MAPLSDSELQKKCSIVSEKYEDLKRNLLYTANQDHKRALADVNYHGPILTDEEFNDKLQQICHNVAWMIFGDVNSRNNTEQVIDLACLETLDAQAIVKMKIYDLAKAIRENPQEYDADEVLSIVYSDDHVVPYEDDQFTVGGGSDLQFYNAILSTVSEELGLDHFYVP